MARKEKSPPAVMDMTPMIDVVFQLMIFFIVTIKMSKDINQDVKLELAKHGPAIKGEEQMIVVEIDRRGNISSHGAFVTRQAFRNILRYRYNRMGTFPILIRADRRTRHEDVKAVMDICTDIGIWRLSFAGIKEKKT